MLKWNNSISAFPNFNFEADRPVSASMSRLKSPNERGLASNRFETGGMTARCSGPDHRAAAERGIVERSSPPGLGYRYWLL